MNKRKYAQTQSLLPEIKELIAAGESQMIRRETTIDDGE